MADIARYAAIAGSTYLFAGHLEGSMAILLCSKLVNLTPRSVEAHDLRSVISKPLSNLARWLFYRRCQTLLG